jgi:ABC-type multidrug transport system fused ATPase/permease subunit
MKKIRNSGLYILGIVLVLVNILYFVIPFKRGSIFWLSDGFVFVAIGLQILTHYLAYRNADTMKKKVYAFPITETGYFYISIQMILSLVFIILAGLLSIPLWIPIVIYSSILCYTLIKVIIADNARDYAENVEQQTEADTEFIKETCTKLQILSAAVQDSRTKEAVRKLADDFRYSDPVSSPARKITEARIPSLIDTLEQAVKEQRQEEITAVIAQIKETLAERNAKCRKS